ncbi:hypothetical protein IF803_39785 [Bradyrhizobium sp. UFLA06-06]
MRAYSLKKGSPKAPLPAHLSSAFSTSGLTMLGKTAAPEYSLLVTTESRLHGPTCNPWNPAHTPGGSSGGAAAAVAARVLPVAAAGDGGGSIRIPASACGVFGLKPTRAHPDRTRPWPGLGRLLLSSRGEPERTRQCGLAGCVGWPRPYRSLSCPAGRTAVHRGGHPRTRPTAHRVHRGVALR